MRWRCFHQAANISDGHLSGHEEMRGGCIAVGERGPLVFLSSMCRAKISASFDSCSEVEQDPSMGPQAADFSPSTDKRRSVGRCLPPQERVMDLATSVDIVFPTAAKAGGCRQADAPFCRSSGRIRHRGRGFSLSPRGIHHGCPSHMRGTRQALLAVAAAGPRTSSKNRRETTGESRYSTRHGQPIRLKRFPVGCLQ